MLPSSNLTNLVLTGAFSYSFISFAAHTILPTLAAAVAVFPVLAFGLFASRELVPREIDVVELQHSVSESDSPPSGDSASRHAPGDLTDRRGAIFGSALLGVTLGVLIGTSPLKIPVWQVTVPPALIMLGRDIWHDRKMWRKESAVEIPEGQLESNSSPDQIELQPIQKTKTDESEAPQSDTTERKGRSTLVSYIENFKRDTLPTVMSIIPRLPVSLVLFAFCMFILVQALTTWGWVEVFAGWWSAWIRVCMKNGTGAATVGAIGGMLLASVLLCNVSSLIDPLYSTFNLLGFLADLWYEHRHNYPPRQGTASLARLLHLIWHLHRPQSETRLDLRARTRDELWRVHVLLLCVARGTPVERYPAPEGYCGSTETVCNAEPPDCRCRCHFCGCGASCGGLCRCLINRPLKATVMTPDIGAS